jgi:hypothetical protein
VQHDRVVADAAATAAAVRAFAAAVADQRQALTRWTPRSATATTATTSTAG